MWHRRSRSFPQATTETAFNSKPATGFRAYVSRNVGVRKSPLQRLRICSDTNKTIRKTVFHHHRKCLIAQIEGILAQSNNCWFRRRLCYRERLGVFALAELRKRFCGIEMSVSDRHSSTPCVPRRPSRRPTWGLSRRRRFAPRASAR